MSYIPSLSETRSIIKDPAERWRWSAIFPTDITGFSPQSNISSGYTSAGNLSIGGSGLLPTATVPFGRVQSMNLPGLSIDTDDRFSAAQVQHYPRHLTVDELTINFYEDCNYNTMQYLTLWRGMIVDKMHNFVPANKYKKTIYFFAFDSVDNKTPRIIGTMRYCFPTNPGVGLQWETTESGIVTIPCTFSVGDVEITYNPSAR
jgi:hypothetical protein